MTPDDLYASAVEMAEELARMEIQARDRDRVVARLEKQLETSIANNLAAQVALVDARSKLSSFISQCGHPLERVREVLASLSRFCEAHNIPNYTGDRTR